MNILTIVMVTITTILVIHIFGEPIMCSTQLITIANT